MCYYPIYLLKIYIQMKSEFSVYIFLFDFKCNYFYDQMNTSFCFLKLTIVK